MLLGPGQAFVDSFLLTPDGDTITDGDSGSWVVDPETGNVYGHVVATDPFGDAYVIPFDNLLDDIRRCLNATSVKLPEGSFVH
ncbi:hypothetical protein PT974_10725 [Cladobotryum mycophilum]|uniref:Uncharacterized protein n=1 Tax=Cladobotryum mycophilum TaxID=491253 RepID=A0ABR0SAR3_9HYPO